MPKPTLVIHGGAGKALSSGEREQRVRQALGEILERLWEALERGVGARNVATMGCMALEDCELFNAGLGSAIQDDGQVRMSASLMDGARQAFSGVINVQAVQNPAKMADFLQEARDRVLSDQGAERLARELGLPLFDPVVERRLSEWVKQRRAERTAEQAAVTAQEAADDGGRGSGTVGVVVVDQEGKLAAATSTGGRGFERVGRVSDSATVAGNYANGHAAVSCTGIGEDITDEAMAARIAIRVEDGWSLARSLQESMEAARGRQRRLAAIAVGRDGEFGWAKTTELLLAVGRSEKETSWAF